MLNRPFGPEMFDVACDMGVKFTLAKTTLAKLRPRERYLDTLRTVDALEEFEFLCPRLVVVGGGVTSELSRAVRLGCAVAINCTCGKNSLSVFLIERCQTG